MHWDFTKQLQITQRKSFLLKVRLSISCTFYDFTFSTTSLIIKGASHCADMHNDRDKDSPQLLNARKAIRNVIKGWLG